MVGVVVSVVLGLAVSCNGFREDEFACEQAVVHLTDCCPDFKASTINCSYNESLDCSDRVVARAYPALSSDDSHCIKKKSCGDLVSSGACVRAQGSMQRVVAVDGGPSTPSSSRVCNNP